MPLNRNSMSRSSSLPFPASKSSSILALTRRIRLNKRVQKWAYNTLNWILRNNDDLQTLNCGLVPQGGFQVDESFGDALLTRLGLELYHHAGSHFPIPVAGKKILELGCGRGGGTAYLAKVFLPRKIVGVDFSTRSIQLCQQRYRAPNLHFQIGDATRPTFQSETFDLILSIETVHMIADKMAFFTEAKRLLKPGGYLLYLDFIYGRGLSAHSVESIEETIHDSGWITKERTDLTCLVLEALETASPIREALIVEKCPALLRNQIHEFCMTDQSDALQSFKDRRTRYLFYTLQNPY